MTREMILEAAAAYGSTDGIACVNVSPGEAWHIVDNGRIVGLAGHNAFAAGHAIRKYVAQVQLADDTVVIPDDGDEHSCTCGRGGFSVWDFDGMLSWSCVTNDDGERVTQCPSCDRTLVAEQLRSPRRRSSWS